MDIVWVVILVMFIMGEMNAAKSEVERKAKEDADLERIWRES